MNAEAGFFFFLAIENNVATDRSLYVSMLYRFHYFVVCWLVGGLYSVVLELHRIAPYLWFPISVIIVTLHWGWLLILILWRVPPYCYPLTELIYISTNHMWKLHFPFIFINTCYCQPFSSEPFPLEWSDILLRFWFAFSWCLMMLTVPCLHSFFYDICRSIVHFQWSYLRFVVIVFGEFLNRIWVLTPYNTFSCKYFSPIMIFSFCSWSLCYTEMFRLI